MIYYNKEKQMEVLKMSEYIIGGLIFVGIFIIPMLITTIIEKVKGCKSWVTYHRTQQNK